MDCQIAANFIDIVLSMVDPIFKKMYLGYHLALFDLFKSKFFKVISYY